MVTDNDNQTDSELSPKRGQNLTCLELDAVGWSLPLLVGAPRTATANQDIIKKRQCQVVDPGRFMGDLLFCGRLCCFSFLTIGEKV